MDDYEDRPSKRLPARHLEEIANQLRADAGLSDDEPNFDVARALWRLAKLPGPLHGLRITPRADTEMGNKEAWATSPPPEITIRESRLSQPDDPETRFILSHELFHVVLHPGARSFLVIGGNKKIDFRCKDDLLAIYHNDDSVEMQATVGARAFLMPPKLVRGSPTPSALAKHCRVPQREAALRFAMLPSVKKSPAEVTAFLEAGRASERQTLWNELPTISGEPPSQVRLAGLFQIVWHEFQQMTECGWTIENGKIVTYLEIRAARFGR